MIIGIVLAAGASSRMGRSKALLPCGTSGSTFVATLAATLREGGVGDTLIVGRPDDGPLRAEVEREGARFVPNPHHEQGQLASLLAGLEAADRPGVDAILVNPVDAPLVAPATVAALIRTFEESHAPIVRAAHAGRHGHPVVFSRAVFADLRGADPAVGARAVLRLHAERVVNVEVGDATVLADVDTPDDYARYFGRRL